MYTFDIEAMNTSLTIQIDCADFIYAKSAAFDCFRIVNTMEELISMYKFGSDISMINSSECGSITKIADSTQECLLAAFRAAEMSGGAIDVCMGEYFLNAKRDKSFDVPAVARRGKFAFDAENYLVQKIEEGRIDLGCIGKGFALDKISETLSDVWDIKSAFISFGASSIYALGAPEGADAWQITLAEAEKYSLKDAAVGASGTAVLGAHIIDARSGKIPQNQPYRTWAFGASAAFCDAMSTAFMILDESDIKKICSDFDMSAAIQKTPESAIEFLAR